MPNSLSLGLLDTILCLRAVCCLHASMASKQVKPLGFDRALDRF